MRFLSFLLGLIYAFGVSSTAHAADNIDPQQVRIITPTEATSDCIGDPKTPVCAVETFMACVERLDMSLCNKVGVFTLQLPDQPGSARYHILSVRILEEKDIPPGFSHIDWIKPGYADITILELSTIRPWCPEGCNFGYNAKPTSTGWEVTAWALWGDDEF